MDDIADIFKALSDQNRLQTVCALEEGRLCACQIIELLGLAPSTVSRHMAVLAHAGLVKGTKQQRWVYYELAGKDAAEPVRETLELLRGFFRDRPDMQKIKENIREIKALSPEELCRRKEK